MKDPDRSDVDSKKKKKKKKTPPEIPMSKISSPDSTQEREGRGMWAMNDGENFMADY